MSIVALDTKTKERVVVCWVEYLVFWKGDREIVCLWHKAGDREGAIDKCDRNPDSWVEARVVQRPEDELDENILVSQRKVYPLTS